MNRKRRRNLMGDKKKGIYCKFNVTRCDGRSDPGEKHDGCDYFVLDLVHDKHAIPAIEAYAKSCKADGYEQLSKDLELTLKVMKNRHDYHDQFKGDKK
jgi:hypothetical protein